LVVRQLRRKIKMKEIAYSDITPHGRLRPRSKLTWSDDDGDWDWLELDVSRTTSIKDGRSIHLWLTRCVKCNVLFSIRPCENCGEVKFRGTGMADGGPDGIGCIRCNTGRARWNCSACGTDNLYEGTIASYNSRACYIATAVCDPKDATVLVTLRRFRDQCLMGSAFGRLLVAGYEFVSPPVAQFIGKSSAARWCTRCFVVLPAAHIAGRLIEWMREARG
jgi:hypothetical protein